jgi:colanic acid/amylovoran biosynthesis glycosyltransferase
MKVSYLINQYPKTSHTFIRREIFALERRGFEVQRIALRGWDQQFPDAEDQSEQANTKYVLKQGLKALLFPAIRAFCRSPKNFLEATALALKMAKSSDRSLFYHIVYLAEACRILYWVQDFGADRIHAHFGTNSTNVVMFVRVLGGPRFSFTVHGPDEFLKPMGLEEKVHRSDFVVAISSFGRSQMYMRARYTDWPKINVVHCGLEPSFYESAATPLVETSRLVCVGRLCEAKGQLLLIEAAVKLRTQGVPFQIVFAGDGPLRPEIERLIHKYDLGEQIRITGWISSSEVRNEILAARALVLPSFAEGLPVAIMEAMALRRPVLTTYVAGIPELVKNGESGWLFPAGSVNKLASGMIQCLQTPVDVLQKMGNAGYERFVQRHTSDTEVGKLAALFLSPNAVSLPLAARQVASAPGSFPAVNLPSIDTARAAQNGVQP